MRKMRDQAKPLSPGDFPSQGLAKRCQVQKMPGLLDSPCGMHRWIAAQRSMRLAYAERQDLHVEHCQKWLV